MTCREKLMKEHPDYISDSYMGGCRDCPSSYGYLHDPDRYCYPTETTCRDCWDREIPENKEETNMNPNEGAPNMIHAYVPRATIECGALEKTKEIIEEWEKNNALKMNDRAPQILDSGDRTQFESGAVRDMREGKGRCDLMPLEVVSLFIGSDGMDAVLDCIADFQKTNDTKHLYNALAYFDEGHWDNCYTMCLEVAKHFEEGAKKYGENNWQKGIPSKCYIDSAIRHYLKWLRGDDDEPHDRAFVWNLMCCIWEVDYHKETK